MARTDPHRHEQLRKLLQRLVSLSCPKDLYNHQDDIAQTVLIRLVNKLDEVEARFWLWVENPEQGGDAKLLKACLREIETFGDRKALAKLLSSATKCLAAVPPPVAQLRACLIELRQTDGETIFAYYYVRRNVHWAIRDERKKLHRRPDVLPLDDDGPPQAATRPRTTSLTDSLAIRQAVQDCLAQMPEAMRLSTVLALQGHKVPEIAKLLELRVRQAESRVRRGKEFLRECLHRKGVGQ